MSETAMSPEQLVDAIYNFAANEMASGVSPKLVEKKLMEQGLEAETAAMIVKNLKQARAKIYREAGLKNMVVGALWCVGGIAVTALTYQMASGSGGHYVVAWGAVVFGGLQCVRGLFQAVVNLV